MKINSISEFNEVYEELRDSLEKQTKKIIVCGGTGCVAGGALKIFDELNRLLTENNIAGEVNLDKKDDNISLKKSGCPGLCEAGPLVRVEPDNILYTKVKVEDCEEIIKETYINKKPVERLMLNIDEELLPNEEHIPFYLNQSRLVLDDCGKIDAESIEEYIGRGGYLGLVKALSSMKPKDVCDIVTDSKLRGRGGGGFPTGKKWSQVLSYSSDVKYVICNGDEGDPGAFMDMCIMEGIPHSILEGMTIAAYATGATEGYIYVRAEYPLAVKD